VGFHGKFRLVVVGGSFYAGGVLGFVSDPGEYSFESDSDLILVQRTMRLSVWASWLDARLKEACLLVRNVAELAHCEYISK
jgi:hypothetical protein